MKKYFLSSMLVMGLMVPALGADGIIAGGAGTCTVDVLGVYENDATANTIATWSLESYECPAGQYLNVTEDTIECTECPTGSYCPGGTYTVESENKGATTCPTDYTSDASATAESECYMGCETSCSVNVACPAHSNSCTHSAFKTTGKQNVGGTCNAYPSVCPIADFQCDMGYNKVVMDDVVAFFNNYDSTSISLFDCTLSGKDGNQQTNDINDCNIVEPGQAMAVYENSNNGQMFVQIMDVSFNSYDINTPGIVKKEYQLDKMPDSDLTNNFYYLPNANLPKGITGKNMWVRISKIGVGEPGYISFMNLLNDDNTDQEVMLMAFISVDAIVAEFGLHSESSKKVKDVFNGVRSGTLNKLDEMKNELQSIADVAPSEDATVITENIIPYAETLYKTLSFYKTLSGMLKPQTLEAMVNFFTLQYSGGSDEEFMNAYTEYMKSILKYEIQFVPTNSPWMYHGIEYLDSMADASVTVLWLSNFIALESHQNLIELIEPKITASYCSANTINIDWNPDNGGVHIQNMCYYDGVVALPSDPVKPGYTFTGWKLVE